MTVLRSPTTTLRAIISVTFSSSSSSHRNKETRLAMGRFARVGRRVGGVIIAFAALGRRAAQARSRAGRRWPGSIIARLPRSRGGPQRCALNEEHGVVERTGDRAAAPRGWAG